MKLQALLNESVKIDTLIRKTMKKFGIADSNFASIKAAVEDDYSDGDISQCTERDVVEIIDASGLDDEALDEGAVDTEEVCTYCGDERGSKPACCGEVHFERQDKNGNRFDLDGKPLDESYGRKTYTDYDKWKKDCTKFYPEHKYEMDGNDEVTKANGTEVGRWLDNNGFLFTEAPINEGFKIVTPDGKQVGEVLPTREAALAKWKTISSEKRAGLKIVSESSYSELIEVSKDTLKSYITKGSVDAVNLASKAAYKLASGEDENDDGEADDAKAVRRTKSIARAVEKLSEEFFIVTPSGVRVGKGHPTRENALAYWKKISPKMQVGLKIVEESLSLVTESQWAVVTPDGKQVGDVHSSEEAALSYFKSISEKMRKGLKIQHQPEFSIVTPAGTKVGQSFPTRELAVAKWNKISEKNRTGLKIVSESVIDVVMEDVEQCHSYAEWKKACRLAAPECQFAGSESGAQATDWTTSNNREVGNWDGKHGTVHVSESIISEDDTMADVLSAKDAAAEGSAKYQEYLAMLRKNKGEAHSKQVHTEVQKQKRDHNEKMAELVESQESKEFMQGFNYNKNYKMLHGSRGSAELIHNPYDAGSNEYKDWNAGFKYFNNTVTND